MFLLPLLFAFTLYGQGVTVSGKINVTPQAKSNQFWFSTILIVQGTKIIASAVVDTSCRFKVNINGVKAREDNMHADIYIAAIGNDTLYIKPIALIPNSIINCDIELPNKYNKNVLGDVICPRCNKTDYVVPIRRGWTQVKERHIKNRDTTFTPSSKEHFISGDVGNEFEALWYCKKCSIKF